ncbi:hypothetical protein [Streptomyces sp. Tue6028]|uniref:hypothetical protein n=1 Tax=Streptomyces sp. Tue6028 TaxID=2036037 RepID=UPI003D757EAF
MKKLTTRVALAAATVTMTGSALLAVTGTASAATLPAQHHAHPTTAVVTVPATTPAQPAAQHGAHPATVVNVTQHTGLSRIGQGWFLSDGQREWHGERDASGYSYWRSDDNGHQLRYDGHRVYHRHHGQWVAVAQADERAYAFDRWHFNQLWTVRVLENPYGI